MEQSDQIRYSFFNESELCFDYNGLIWLQGFFSSSMENESRMTVDEKFSFTLLLSYADQRKDKLRHAPWLQSVNKFVAAQFTPSSCLSTIVDLFISLITSTDYHLRISFCWCLPLIVNLYSRWIASPKIESVTIWQEWELLLHSYLVDIEYSYKLCRYI